MPPPSDRTRLLLAGVGVIAAYESLRRLLLPSLATCCRGCASLLGRLRLADLSRPRRRSRARALKLLRHVTAIHGTLGMDFGGTLAKCVLAEQLATPIPAEFGESNNGSPVGATHASLALTIRRVRLPSSSDLSSASSASASSDDEAHEGGTLSMQFISGPTAALEEVLESQGQHRLRRAPGLKQQPRQVCATGGGAHKLRARVLEEFNVELVPVHEMESVIEGLLALHALQPHESLFTVSEMGTPTPVAWPEEMFPLLLINIGSGVSVLQVDGLLTTESGDVVPKFRRVGGTPCGGATFLGLAKLLTRRPEIGFHAALELASRGEAWKVDKLVRDIYGEEGSSHLGLSPNHTAAHFGKLVSFPRTAHPVPNNSFKAGAREPWRHETDLGKGLQADWPSDEDMVASLLDMVSQASAVLAKAYAGGLGKEGGGRRIFFSGGFVSANPRARAALARNLRALGDEALFLRHSDFLGALGALTRSWPGGPRAFRREWRCSD